MVLRSAHEIVPVPSPGKAIGPILPFDMVAAKGKVPKGQIKQRGEASKRAMPQIKIILLTKKGKLLGEASTFEREMATNVYT